MSEQNIYNPKMEDIINEAFTGEMLKNALDFVGFLRANEFQTEFNPDEYEKGKWTGAIGGVVGDSIAYMLIHPNTEFPSPWTIWLNEYDFNEDSSEDNDELKKFVLENLNYCAKCNPDWDKCRDGDKTIFGRRFENLCHSPMFFYTPDAQKLEKLNRIMLKIRQKRDDLTDGDL